MAVATAAPIAAAPRRIQPRTGLRSFWLRLRRTRLAPVGLAIVAVFVGAALLAPVLAPYDPAHQQLLEFVQNRSGRARFAVLPLPPRGQHGVRIGRLAA